MATQRFEKLKVWALLAFLALNLILVGLIWSENLTGSGSEANGFVRSGPEDMRTSPAITATRTRTPAATSPVNTPQPTAAGTPQPLAQTPTSALPPAVEDK